MYSLITDKDSTRIVITKLELTETTSQRYVVYKRLRDNPDDFVNSGFVERNPHLLDQCNIKLVFQSVGELIEFKDVIDMFCELCEKGGK